MSELKKEVKVFKVEYTCDSCLQGTMIAQKSFKPFLHVCNSCGIEQVLEGKAYPNLYYEEV